MNPGPATRVIGVALCSLTSACGALARHPVHACPGGLESSFIQIGQRELGHGVPEWKRDLELLQSVGIRSVVLQYSGDEHGPFDGRTPGREPVRALLNAASALEMSVLLGLYMAPSWPSAFPIDEMLAPPLGRPAEIDLLVRACAAFRACAGWYIPEEIDDRTWSAPERSRRVRRFLARTASELRRLTPGRAIAISPFFTSTLDPLAHARWWRELLADRPVDILMLQDGVGSGNGSAAAAQRALVALRPSTEPLGVSLWSTVELFHQIHGPPRDALPFEATPAEFEAVRQSIEAERAAGARLVAFAALDYMDPARNAAAARLYRSYAAWCARQRGAADQDGLFTGAGVRAVNNPG